MAVAVLSPSGGWNEEPEVDADRLGVLGLQILGAGLGQGAGPAGRTDEDPDGLFTGVDGVGVGLAETLLPVPDVFYFNLALTYMHKLCISMHTYENYIEYR